MKLKIPNILTIGRIILVPFFIGTFYLPGAMGDWIPFFIFVLASFTDFLDGLLARLYKEESKLGELLDPIADKIIVAAALVLLVMNGIIKNYIVEVKPLKQTTPPKKPKKQTRGYIREAYEYARNQAKWKVAKEFCKDRRWEFKVITEKELGIK